MEITKLAGNTIPYDKKKMEKLEQACKDFESIFISKMLKTMRKTVPENSLFGSSNQKDIYNAMYDEQLASFIANGRKPLGIGEQLYKELANKMETLN